jgi:adenylate cyclase
MTLTLRDLERCFEGVIPPVIATASASGEPNVTYLSSLLMVDDDHVVASNQFFGKTVANLAENPRACVLVHDHDTGHMYRLRLHFERRDVDGPVFDELSRRIDAIAKMTGMESIFKLRSADVYRVVACEPLS